MVVAHHNSDYGYIARRVWESYHYTGIGTMLGLDALSIPIESPAVVSRSGEGELEFRQDEIEILIPANSGLECTKFFLETHSNINYEWSSPSSLYFDMHGEPGRYHGLF